MKSSPRDTEKSAARTPVRDTSTLSSFDLIMKIRRDLARALQGLPGSSLPAHSSPIRLRFRGATPGPPIPLIFSGITEPMKEGGGGGSGEIGPSKGSVVDQSQEVGQTEGGSDQQG